MSIVFSRIGMISLSPISVLRKKKKWKYTLLMFVSIKREACRPLNLI